MKPQNNSKSSLADKIAGILNTAPSSFDPEDDAVDATNAQVLNEDIEEPDELEEHEAILSKFRRANVDLLADLDDKYAGKKTSRRNLKDSDSEDSINSEDEGDQDDNDEDLDDCGSSMERSLDGGEKLADGGAASDEDEDDDEDGSSGDDDEEEEEEEEEEEDQNFKHMSETNVSNQIKKGLCVRNQMAKWENLLEMRIQLQKCLLTANKMPQPSTFAELKKEAEFSNKVNATTTMLGATLDKLLLLQKSMEKQFPETKSLGQQTKKADAEDDDEEIPSDTENEESANEEEEVESSSRKGKKRKLEEYEKEISEHHKKYKDYRNSVVQKWNDKTRVAVKGGSTSHSILDQIEYNLSNKDKLIQRTQTKRSQYTILGEESNDVESNAEIFDDDDFYHQLLRELIEVKSADVTDPVQLGRQWIQLQNMRSKMKRKVDTKATKGRKIRYAVHSKLVNFMAAMEEKPWTEEARNELYSSLFGKN